MNYLIDTNIISELRKGPAMDPGLAAWYATIDDDALYLSVLVVGEIRRGVERLRPRDAARAQALETWLDAVKLAFAGRILAIDEAVGEVWGQLTTGRSVPAIDGLLAATAKARGMTLVTRNVRDLAGLNVTILNPFAS
ncbi:type II toxin-antitoxin system VapC family toxin [Oleomonas cavernae]|uniref:Ribonuclease VapC n=1 Tax=Oleomonas cavernae TaxID=2320859 RepID=A0A418WHH3_9PROT|nr:type II toxin-antitoxin system VapC family toxin [Oleomonas cavernae]RJF89438.1 type II toxin-antitoxin system VapC family toxin [Oleomonas cavernae]